MTTIKFTTDGFLTDDFVTPSLFVPLGNTCVLVECEVPFYGKIEDFGDMVCCYMNSFMPKDCKVMTHHVTLDLSTGEDENGKYITRMILQVFI